MNLPGLPIHEFDRKSWIGRSEGQKVGMMFNHMVDCAGCCNFVFGTYPFAIVLLEFLNAITGWNYDKEDTLKAGERIANVRQTFNVREGINLFKFAVSDNLTAKPPLKDGPAAGKTNDWQTISREFCKAMSWETKTAKPNLKRLVELGMEDIAAKLHA